MNINQVIYEFRQSLISEIIFAIQKIQMSKNINQKQKLPTVKDLQIYDSGKLHSTCSGMDLSSFNQKKFHCNSKTPWQLERSNQEMHLKLNMENFSNNSDRKQAFSLKAMFLATAASSFSALSVLRYKAREKSFGFLRKKTITTKLDWMDFSIVFEKKKFDFEERN